MRLEPLFDRTSIIGSAEGSAKKKSGTHAGGSGGRQARGSKKP